VLVETPNVNREALRRVEQRVSALEERLTAEFRRYRASGSPPFAFVVFGPIPQRVRPPKSATDGWFDLVRHAFELSRFTRDVDERAGVPSRGFDARLYLVATAPTTSGAAFVEGASEQGGHVGVAWAELDESMADFALFVAAHELFHTLGASDKYDAAGRTIVPDGLAEPEKIPILPQAFVELMARNRPIEASVEVPPSSLHELAVGPRTALEVGWSEPP
jgi:hypothetical protein